MLGLHGEMETTSSSLIPMIFDTSNADVAVAVSVMIFACAGSKLRISLIRNSRRLKVSPLS